MPSAPLAPTPYLRPYPYRSRAAAAAAAAAIAMALSACNSLEETREKSDEALLLPPMAPELTYRSQCARCHEPALIGAKPSRLYNAPPLNGASIDKIGRDSAAAITLVGGKLLGKSRWMPAYEEKLTPERVGELIDYLQTR